MKSPSIDLDRLLKLRLVVARFGEMDLARWWNTKGSSGSWNRVPADRIADLQAAAPSFRPPETR